MDQGFQPEPNAHGGYCHRGKSGSDGLKITEESPGDERKGRSSRLMRRACWCWGQILVGFQYRSFLEPDFIDASPSCDGFRLLRFMGRVNYLT